ncbi:molybdopterin molybdenumtransferase MoeA [Chromobacterium sphagni]|uniref:Molybdopterin molybdenumtransferase n=1 Tax=Chromobacterium sphagni TaxID=1903179 RepID=A0A1S1X4T2_9NEIS|nr:gephyrin-like molybdotransferase Glp [Chromobacterium sphagni]OHX14440.1 molybdopterin molybdenumtransferase MoeA [Chromobacterium sphagni]
MLDFEDAQRYLADYAQPLAHSGMVPLGEAPGRVLARTLTAELEMPPADNSAMDGYALRCADVAPGVALPVQQRCYAGEAPQALLPGQAIRLFTGSLLPAGADAVAMQEDADEAGGRVRINRQPLPGQHIRRRGEDVAAGSVLLEAGCVLGPGHIALLASQGLAEAQVFQRVKVGILTTGDELAAPGGARAPQQIYNSNGAMLAALAAGMGAQVAACRHARDDADDLRRAFAELGRDCDLVLSVGGVSVGERDLVKPALASLGAELDLWKVRMKPGKPVALTRLGRTPVVCLPGNPVSAYVVFALLVTPLIRRLQGRSECFPPVSRLRLASGAQRKDCGREDFLRVSLQLDADGEAQLTPHGRQAAGIISALPGSSGLARLPAERQVADGERVAYYDWRHWLA